MAFAENALLKSYGDFAGYHRLPCSLVSFRWTKEKAVASFQLKRHVHVWLIIDPTRWLAHCSTRAGKLLGSPCVSKLPTHRYGIHVHVCDTVHYTIACNMHSCGYFFGFWLRTTQCMHLCRGFRAIVFHFTQNSLGHSNSLPASSC